MTAAPAWLLAGLVVGTLLSVLIAGAFLVGARLFPAPGTATASGDRADGDGSSRRRTDVRNYLGGIDEEFFEGYVAHGEEVDFYLPRRDVAITFDAQVYFSLAEADTYAVLYEHEMPVHHLGRRLPFEVSGIGQSVGAGVGPPGAGDVPVGAESVDVAFAELGIDRTTDVAAVRDAYRRRVKDVHPDQGGSKAAFRRVSEAYATARNYTARAGGSAP
ncbi:molecular chaperone DnaJ [Halalkaliarchaeum desulfuricum]|uniref:Molecular chaperone DnaJ n=1 Tax=Halalkaliarchaeum desulfuricum TaxID=2055893 RepID=A0A343TGF8_9EURY|nr:molecular chaperone DnaJ [Halalkaliarchaeum desulfuricum]